GLDAMLPGSLDPTQELEPHEQFQSLKNGFDPRPPAAANLRGPWRGCSTRPWPTTTRPTRSSRRRSASGTWRRSTRGSAGPPAGRYAGERLRADGNETYRIEQCDSPLAARVALVDEEPGVTLTVLVTGLSDHELGEDVLVRLAGRKLYAIDSWQIVKELFQ